VALNAMKPNIYTTHSNLLQSAHGQIITTDLAGNIISDGLYSYVYNQAGQLAQIKQGATTVASYVYDYQTHPQVGRHHYDLADHLIAETNSLGVVQRT
jgi:hypothetical protein